MKFQSIIMSIVLLIAAGTTSHAFNRVLFYETFEEKDTRNGGFIIPEGAERIRVSGRLPFTEMEIEAPASDGNAQPLARFVSDPTGLSLVALQLEDAKQDIGDGSFGANGGVSLLESILLDRGDLGGTAAVSWMAVPLQANETGGTMFPETDTRVDAGPEGLNLIGFGGIQRDFDTGDPIPGLDFSNQLIINQEGSAVLSPVGAAYTPNLPTFFTLLFDLERSLYDLWINGVLVREDLPFFDIAGETGKTLRELELISSARGVGTFLYDNLVQIDPDAPYEPVPFRAPVIADDAEWNPLFMENFDDNPRNRALKTTDFADLPGSTADAVGPVMVVEDTTYRSLAWARMPSDSLYLMHHRNCSQSLRFSFRFMPQEGSTFLLSIAGEPVLDVTAAGTLKTYNSSETGRRKIESDIVVIPDLPHWLSMELDPQSGGYSVRVYRAVSLANAQTVVLEATGSIPTRQNFNRIQITNFETEIWIDDLLIAERNETPKANRENRYRAIVHETFESPTQLVPDGFSVVGDPTGWSQSALQGPSDGELTILDNASLTQSLSIAWTAIPQQTDVPASRLTLHFPNGDTQEIIGLFADERIGLYAPTTITYEANSRVNFNIYCDLERSIWKFFYPNSKRVLMQGRLAATQISGISLSGLPDGTILYDDIVVIENPVASSFEPNETDTAVRNEAQRLLFEEDFENNPAGSAQVVNELDPRRSGLPIPTRSSGFSDLADTGIPGTRLMVGSPSADAEYVTDPDSSSLYALSINDRFDPQAFAGFESALPFTPISTLRTTPYAFVIPTLAEEPERRYFHIRWSAWAKQANRTGLVLFPSVQDAEVPLPQSSIVIPAPSGQPLFAFGQNGMLQSDTDGDGMLDNILDYDADISYRFQIRIDRESNTFDLTVNEETVVVEAPFAGTLPASDNLRLGWFTALVNDGDGVALQQSDSSGGHFIIDDIRIFETDTVTVVNDFGMY